jgi:hypothetical protein
MPKFTRLDRVKASLVIVFALSLLLWAGIWYGIEALIEALIRIVS